MAYSKNTWVNGSSQVNATNMNHIEQGIYDNSNNIETMGTNITNNTNSIQKLTPVILWTNENPTSSFGEQNVTLNSSDYDFYEIIYKQANDIDRTFNSGLILENTGTILNFNTTTLYYRVVSANSKTNIHFDNGQIGSGASSNAVIPLYIIGYKTELISNV